MKERNIEFKIIGKEHLKSTDKQIFGELLREQGKVDSDKNGNFNLKADRCLIICIVFIDKKPISIGAIKKKTNYDFESEYSNLPELSLQFDWELGYLYTKEQYSKKGIASSVIKYLLDAYGNKNIMASTEISANPAMVHLLEKNGFRHYGNPWKSRKHSNFIGLFLRFK